MQADIRYPQMVPIKVMGEAGVELLETLHQVLARHLKPGSPIDIDSRSSRTGRYTSFTATFMADNREQLRAIYSDLHQAECVRFLL